MASSAHFGCRIVESQQAGKPDGMLFLTLGERFVRKDDTQKLDNHHGKIVRIHKDGALWTHEHGPQGGDEINLIQPGRNYGWPTWVNASATCARAPMACCMC